MFHQIVMILAKDCWAIKFIDQVISFTFNVNLGNILFCTVIE